MAKQKEDVENQEPTLEELAKEGLTIVEDAKFEVVQTDMFAQFVKRQEGTHDIVFAEETPFEVWESYTRGTLEMGRRTMRDAGICLIFGERKYGERYAQVIDAMRYNPKTLQNATWVVSHVKVWHDRLSFAHHEVVAALPDKAQEEMLTVAENEGLTVAKFKKVKQEKYPDKKAAGKKNKTGDKKPPKIDLTDENEVLQAGHMLIAFLEKAEADLAFREWPNDRKEKWRPVMESISKINRRGWISTHGKK